MYYRRSKTAGASFFFTVVTYNRRRLFENPENIKLLRAAIQKVKLIHPFKTDAFVVLHDHLHFMWTLPIDDNDFSTRWRLIKSYFTRACSQRYKTEPNSARKHKDEQCIWQRRFWEHEIKDEDDFIKHVEYIHYNPVKHGYVKSPSDWEHSSFRHYVDKEIYMEDWASGKVIPFRGNIGKE